MYILDEISENIKKIDNGKPYKNITFKTLKDANNFKKFVYKKYYDSINLTTYVTTIQQEIDLLNYLKKLNDRIKPRIELLKVVESYKNGFTNSQEWQDRIYFNYLWNFYIDYWNLLLIKARENIQKEVIKNTNNKYKGTSTRELGFCLYQGIFRGVYNTKEIKEITYDFINNSNQIDQKIKQVEIDYKKLHQKYKLKNEDLNNEKDYLINDLNIELRTKKELQKTNINNLLHCINQKEIIKKPIKELKIEDVKFSINDG